MTSHHLVGLLLGAEEDWPQAFEALTSRLGAFRHSGSEHVLDTERVHIAPFNLRDQARLLSAEALHATDSATTVRVRNGQLAVTDGPFAETKEQLAGFYLIEAVDLNEAISVASRIPPARTGSIEVRPVRELQVA